MAAKPIAGKAILRDDHSSTNHHSIGNTQIAIAGQTIAAENEAADDRLKQIVGKTHSTEDAEMMKHTANALESIPGRDDGRDDHQQDDEVVDGLEPEVKLAEIHKAQRKDCDGRADKNVMPYLQMPALIVKEPLTSQLHAEDEEAE